VTNDQGAACHELMESWSKSNSEKRLRPVGGNAIKHDPSCPGFYARI